VAADLMEVARGIVYGGSGRIACTCFNEKQVVPIQDVETNYYIRTLTDERPGVIAAIASVFGNHGVSLEAVLQKQNHDDSAEIVWITHRTREGSIRDALKDIEALPVVRELGNWIRVEE
jgi:homoserine dehydrogenase